MWTALASLFALILLIVQQWQKNSPDRQREKRNVEIQQGRVDVASGNVDAVSLRVDQAISDTSDPVGESSNPNPDSPTSTLDRLAALGICDGETPRKS